MIASIMHTGKLGGTPSAPSGQELCGTVAAPLWRALCSLSWFVPSAEILSRSHYRQVFFGDRSNQFYLTLMLHMEEQQTKRTRYSLERSNSKHRSGGFAVGEG